MCGFDKLSDFDKGWVVGMLEGEGCFVLRKIPSTAKLRRKRFDFRLNALIEVVSTEENGETVKKLHSLLGGKIHGPYRRNEHKWSLNTKQEVLCLISQIQPFMSKRRATKIQEILSTYEGRR